MQAFDRYIGIDYSGAETPKSSLKGLRVYMADYNGAPTEVPPPPSPRRYWTRSEIAEWLVERLLEGQRTLVGIDHGFSFPLKYFDKYHLPHDWLTFLDDFQRHWPTDEDIYVDFVRDGLHGNGAARNGDTRWRRITEVRAGAKSVFHFDVPGIRCKVHPCRAALVALHPIPCTRCALLALRRLGHTRGPFSRSRGLSIALETRLCAEES
jgi:hypothetical protein